MDNVAHGDSTASGFQRRLRWLLLALVVAVTAFTLWRLFGVPRLPASLVEGGAPSHVRVVLGELPGTYELFWSTADRRPGQSLRVYPGLPADGVFAQVTEIDSARFPDPTGTGLVAWRHHATLPGGNSRFVGPEPAGFQIAYAERPGRVYSIRPAAPEGAVTVLAGGDSLDELGPRRRMNDFLRTQCEADPSIVAFLHGGDFVRRGERLDEWLDWLEDWDRTTTEDGRLLPLVPTRGNHEATGPLFDFVFGQPGAEAGAWFERSIGPDLSVVTLDSNRPVQGEQEDWLRATLEARRDRRWTVVQYHFELWPAIRPRQERAPGWIEAFESMGVDLAIECNGHCVKRTVPILAGERDPAGVPYIGEGGLGAKQRTPDPARWWLQSPGFAANAAHVWKLRFGSERIEGEVLSPDGAADSWRLTAERR